MNEAKSLVNMAIAAMISAMILTGVLTLINLGYTMWSYFSRQDYANQKMKDYVNYVAYDDVVVRGQEVISLFRYADQEGLFLAFYTDTTQDPSELSVDGIIINTGDCRYYIPDTCPWESLQSIASSIPTNHYNVEVGNALSATASTISNPANSRTSTACGDLMSCKTYENLVKLFTNNHPNVNPNPFGYPDITNSKQYEYAGYRSILVYDNDTSTDVIGIILIRQTPETVFK